MTRSTWDSGVLRVINDDVFAPGTGFNMHPHANMEIMSIVLDGELEHKDSMGQKALLKPGDIQKMSAGTGVYHSELNASADKPLHFLQIWILPNIEDIKPAYGHRHFAEDDMLNRLCCVAAPDGRHNAFIIQQDCESSAPYFGKTPKSSTNSNRTANTGCTPPGKPDPQRTNNDCWRRHGR